MNWKRHASLIGNLLLFIAFVMLFYFGALWERLGVGAFLLWMAVRSQLVCNCCLNWFASRIK